MTTDQQARLAYLEGQILRSQLFAQLWVARAITGSAARRDIADGTGRKLTDAEKMDHALGTVLQHIENIESFMDARDALLREAQ
jgi:hypothetical protein